MSQTERKFSPDVEVAFGEWIKTNNIKVVLFDLDDTLIDTNSLFQKQLELFFGFCQNCIPNLNMDGFRADFKELDDKSFELIGVSQKKWDYVIGELCTVYGTDLFTGGLPILHAIYTLAPTTFEGVKETLEVCKKVGLRLGLVTHASEVWTNIKVDQLGLKSYFEHIKVIDIEEHKYKGPAHWQEAVDLFDIDPKNFLVVGDNLKGDIGAAHQIGVKTLAWIPSRWHVYNKGDLPDGVIKLDKIGDLIPAIVNRTALNGH